MEALNELEKNIELFTMNIFKKELKKLYIILQTKKYNRVDLDPTLWNHQIKNKYFSKFAQKKSSLRVFLK